MAQSTPLKMATSSTPSPLKSPTSTWSFGLNCHDPVTRSTALKACVRPEAVRPEQLDRRAMVQEQVAVRPLP